MICLRKDDVHGKRAAANDVPIGSKRKGGKIVKAYELNSKIYNKAKKMDHGQMKSFCEGLYTRGFEAGKREAEGLSDEEVKQTLLLIKGIGEKKACEIVVALTRAKEERKLLANG